MTDFGRAAYVDANRNLTSDLLKVASRNISGSVLAASSGAVSSYQSNIDSQFSYEIYSGVKQEMEDQILESGLFKNIGLMRIWNLSGIYANLDSPYALSSFIKQALAGNIINVTGSKGTQRTYVNAQEMMWVYLMELGNYNHAPLDSGGFNTNLLDLAKLVADTVGDVRVVSAETTSSSPLALYLPNAREFNQMADTYSLTLSNIQQQVEMVVEYMKMAR